LNLEGSSQHEYVIVIPAYRPSAALLQLLTELRRAGAGPLVVIDDGSGPDSAQVFETASKMPGVEVLHHAVNLGKGAALKTGINHVLCTRSGSIGIVTADADGQHMSQDILRVAVSLCAHPGSLILGTRRLPTDAPWRSRFGNRLTNALFRLLAGRTLSDTQTGLRGIPPVLASRLLVIPSNRYEFELDMLLLSSHLRIDWIEVPIQTLYFDSNRGSHFNPLLDSMRIYFVLLRFSLASALTAVIDNTVFVLGYQWGMSIAGSQVLARALAMTFNYAAVRNAVFLSDRDHRRAFPRYLALVAASGFASYAILTWLCSTFGMNPVYAKILAESLLFLANFVIQRDIVFNKDDAASTSDSTDWDKYYRSVPPTARLTRRYTTRRLLACLERCGTAPAGTSFEITEIGGANSCFLEPIIARLAPARYRVIDTNAYGLNLLRSRTHLAPLLQLEQADVLDLPEDHRSEIVFSVGLIEHFNPEQTRQAIQGHLKVARPGGILLLTFPTSTWLYRITRRVCEIAGVWAFPDERPLDRSEVLAAVGADAQLCHEETLWPLVFTQHLMVFQCSHQAASRGAS
jgi:putative flippase GtrA